MNLPGAGPKGLALEYVMESTSRFELQSFMFFMGRLRSESFDDVLQADAEVYLSAMRDRYADQSKGSGDWAELKPSTQAERQRLGFGPTRPILVRDHTLADALIPGNPGYGEEREQDRLRVGYGGGAIHPGYGESQPGATIAEIALYHQTGTSRMPARPILVDPDQTTVNAMQVDSHTSFGKIVNFIVEQSR